MASDLLSSSLLSNSHTMCGLDKLSVIFRILSSIAVGYTFNENWFAASILNEIIDWINNKDAATPRIFWLYGQAGKGKSAIAHTIAIHAQNVGMLGSCFCFSWVRQHEELHMKLFPTIARDLARHDLRVRLRLDEVVSKNYSSKKRPNIMEEWKRLILEPLSRLEGSFTGNVVIVIDALDESGMECMRVAILRVLAAYSAELPAKVQILLTLRPFSDI